MNEYKHVIDFHRHYDIDGILFQFKCGLTLHFDLDDPVRVICALHFIYGPLIRILIVLPSFLEH